MAFEALDKQAMPGYYNSSESSWGGFPIKGDDGSYYLVHAQMANHCDLGSWTENSIVGLSRSTTGRIEGPYAFVRTLLIPFAHNPTIRRADDGTYVIYFIGGWHTQPATCKPPTSNLEDTCAASTKLDPPTQVRQGGERPWFAWTRQWDEDEGLNTSCASSTIEEELLDDGRVQQVRWRIAV